MMLSVTSQQLNKQKRWRDSLYSVLQNLLLFRSGRELNRPVWKTFLLSLLVVSIGLLLMIPTISKLNFSIVSSDFQTTVALDHVVNQKMCGKISQVAAFGSFLNVISNHQSASTALLPEFSIAVSGIKNYCQMLRPQIISENTLAWIFEFLFYFSSSLSLLQLGIGILIIKLILLNIFVFYLLQIGVSIVITEIAFLASIIVQAMMPLQLYAVYSFLPPVTLGFISLVGLCFYFKFYCRWLPLVIMMPLLGLFSFLFVNLRTAYAPIVLGCLVGYFLFSFLELKKKFSLKMNAIFLSISILLISCGFLYANHKLLAPIKKIAEPLVISSTDHGIAHPLVLGLGVPQNKFADERGIFWLDAVGLRLAKQINPSVTFMGPGYEQALFIYYKKLWRFYPKEMLSIYLAKFKLANSSAAKQFLHHPYFEASPYLSHLVRWITFPVRLFSNGWAFLALYLSMLLIAFFGKKMISAEVRFALYSFTLAALGVYFQSAIIMSLYVPNYDGYMVFTIILLGALFLQLAVNLLYWAYKKQARQQIFLAAFSKNN